VVAPLVECDAVPSRPPADDCSEGQIDS
jgi:hypothetical protein